MYHNTSPCIRVLQQYVLLRLCPTLECKLILVFSDIEKLLWFFECQVLSIKAHIMLKFQQKESLNTLRRPGAGLNGVPMNDDDDHFLDELYIEYCQIKFHIVLVKYELWPLIKICLIRLESFFLNFQAYELTFGIQNINRSDI